MRPEPPLPPVELRELVGLPDAAIWEVQPGAPIRPYLEPEVYQAVLDFGCGAGREARQLLVQEPKPERYLGLDLHRGMIEWCRRALEPLDPAFSFVHHDVHYIGLNPDGTRDHLPFPAQDQSFSLVLATSVFTHLLDTDAIFYLRECARVLRPGGVLDATWFLFDKRLFPMMQPFQNTLFMNLADPTNAVIYARDWLRIACEEAGFGLLNAQAPVLRGFHWRIAVRKLAPGEEPPPFELPPDDGPVGSMPAPQMPPNAARLGLDPRSPS
jgi:SAM-dependent methyltransferase